jgi:osmotically-inducible protein OsmY
VKIITLGGVVTLRGPVATASEKSQIEGIAKKTAGVKRVDNQIEVKVK